MARKSISDIRSHTLSRREFGTAFAATLAAGAVVACGPAEGLTMGPTNSARPLGIQLFTIRDAFAADPRMALEMIAAAGFEEVELGGKDYLNVPAGEMRAMLNGMGLAAPAMHVGLKPLQSKLPQLIAYAQEVGARYLVLPSLPNDLKSYEGYRQVAAWCNEWANIAQAEGLLFAYHNHAFEFDALPEGGNGFDILTRETDPELVGLELDVHWIARAGQDIGATLQAHAGRVWLSHLKDITAAGDSFALPGEGVIDFPAIFAAAPAAGLQHFFFEHDRLESANYANALQTAHNYLARVAQ